MDAFVHASGDGFGNTAPLRSDTGAIDMDMLSSFGYRANHAKYTHALAVVARFPPFDHLAYSEAERDKKTPEVYR